MRRKTGIAEIVCGRFVINSLGSIKTDFDSCFLGFEVAKVEEARFVSYFENGKWGMRARGQKAQIQLSDGWGLVYLHGLFFGCAESLVF